MERFNSKKTANGCDNVYNESQAKARSGAILAMVLQQVRQPTAICRRMKRRGLRRQSQGSQERQRCLASLSRQTPRVSTLANSSSTTFFASSNRSTGVLKLEPEPRFRRSICSASQDKVERLKHHFLTDMPRQQTRRGSPLALAATRLVRIKRFSKLGSNRTPGKHRPPRTGISNSKVNSLTGACNVSKVIRLVDGLPWSSCSNPSATE